MTPARTLRPLHLFTDGDVIWAVDEFQPVAALLDASTGTLRDLVSWPRLPPPPTIETWQVLGCGRDLWVQPGAGAVEDLGTGRLPPPSAAVDGFLDV
ncbi:hypothetical protein Acy02nite_35490 [Actinoplanes cyaneus]|uniref:Uncharacterized protein n=1 Tax=Actinoplanes cyaneus TaxID=52696 RepID=A0A919ILK8_9ACTN|nr:hypothetical protein [Actinoplanes cyaneus]MCW2140350.1 hypothetical protein [Actinoplanes cyaneus]GID65668.1 hypothetical protein Acy02nite_35490 [Actinoplanes cyaneus]